MPSTLTLLTDFGTRDAYVGALRGVIASLAPGVPVFDLTHEIAPQDVMEAAFVLRGAYGYFPEGTVHLAVVDPGVGTERRAIALRARGHTFVGPDNGLFALVLGEHAPDALVVLDRPNAWRTATPHPTFHGRDIFAPVAARLAAGASLESIGTPVDSLRVLRWTLPITGADGIRGRVVHVDRYGNAVTNVEGAVLLRSLNGRALRTVSGSAIVRGLSRTYAEVEPGDPLVLVGSAGLVEVAVRNGHAATLLGLERGSPVSFDFFDAARPSEAVARSSQTR
ncbi:MAG TPA: SAM-dependent chlorinase/fluorinase [Rhodothermales bacterium]|nr:SAM-dependent chlorinase/fluorinase [Rhodothermales bacterium]